MDHTTISVGSKTRDAVNAHRDSRGLQNANEAIRDLVGKAYRDERGGQNMDAALKTVLEGESFRHDRRED